MAVNLSDIRSLAYSIVKHTTLPFPTALLTSIGDSSQVNLCQQSESASAESIQCTAELQVLLQRTQDYTVDVLPRLVSMRACFMSMQRLVLQLRSSYSAEIHNNIDIVFKTCTRAAASESEIATQLLDSYRSLIARLERLQATARTVAERARLSLILCGIGAAASILAVVALSAGPATVAAGVAGAAMAVMQPFTAMGAMSTIGSFMSSATTTALVAGVGVIRNGLAWKEARKARRRAAQLTMCAQSMEQRVETVVRPLRSAAYRDLAAEVSACTAPLPQQCHQTESTHELMFDGCEQQVARRRLDVGQDDEYDHTIQVLQQCETQLQQTEITVNELFREAARQVKLLQLAQQLDTASDLL
eukprot:TRINITY_DN14645_c0_g1_i1.p1 TRINITY_DN14645_c0_g1~~TRINITY_DN14645_c0_g1_i1.p1  ORF type:complete len:361 (-),score=84.99 TRINITY_DN14645_c0_g1_i1:21-1103(-)